MCQLKLKFFIPKNNLETSHVGLLEIINHEIIKTQYFERNKGHSSIY